MKHRALPVPRRTVTWRLFGEVRRFLRRHGGQAADYRCEVVAHTPYRFDVQIVGPGGNTLLIESEYTARETAPWLAAARWLLRNALATMQESTDGPENR